MNLPEGPLLRNTVTDLVIIICCWQKAGLQEHVQSHRPFFSLFYKLCFSTSIWVNIRLEIILCSTNSIKISAWEEVPGPCVLPGGDITMCSLFVGKICSGERLKTLNTENFFLCGPQQILWEKLWWWESTILQEHHKSTAGGEGHVSEVLSVENMHAQFFRDTLACASKL